MTEQTLLILASLAGGELHGYGIAQDVEKMSEGRVILGAGTLYGALGRLTAEELITETRESTVGGRRRRYYQLSAAGREALVKEAARVKLTANAIAARAVKASSVHPRLA